VPEKPIKPTLQRCAEVVSAICAIIPFAPQDGMAQSIIATELQRSVVNEAELERVMRVAVTRATKWEGLAGLRHLVLLDSEREFFAQEAERTALLVEGYKQEARALSAEEQVANSRLIEAVKPKRLQ
jgi:hypothetical protein